jgi:hypothetical protein
MRGMWGVKVRRRVVTQASFVCPRCGVDRTGTEVEPQRWFTIGRAPIIPLATLPREVVCATCDHRSDPGVLDIPTSDQLTEYLTMATRSSIAFVVRSGRTSALDFSIGEPVGLAAVAAMTAGGHEYDLTQLRHDVANIDDDQARASLRRLSAELTPYGKQGYLHRMAAIALADGEMSNREQMALIDLGVALGMSAPHINGVLAVAALQPEAA